MKTRLFGWEDSLTIEIPTRLTKSPAEQIRIVRPYPGQYFNFGLTSAKNAPYMGIGRNNNILGMPFVEEVSVIMLAG